MSGQPSPKRQLVRWGVLTIAAVVVAFLRGNHLFGVTVGVVYASGAAGLVWLLARTLTSTDRVSVLRVVLWTLFALPVALAMAFPAFFNEDVQGGIDQQATDRLVRAELAAMFASDPAYADLSVSSVHRKVVCITVRGSVNTRADVERLRSRITKASQAIDRCVLRWDVTLRDTGKRVDGSDQELFPDSKPG